MRAATPPIEAAQYTRKGVPADQDVCDRTPVLRIARIKRVSWESLVGAPSLNVGLGKFFESVSSRAYRPTYESICPTLVSI